MQEGLSKTGAEGDGPGALRKRLDEAVVLQATVAQLRKDLREEALELPEVGEGAFEELRTQVAAVMAQMREQEGAHAFGLVVNRVDLTEQPVHAADGGEAACTAWPVHVVLRCLQKVLSRMRYAGLG
jgi:hypothetical protein